METIGERIKYLRDSKNLSMGQLENAIGAATGSVNRWEKGKSIPGGSSIVDLSNYFNVPTDWILKRETSQIKNDESSIFFIDEREATSRNKSLNSLITIASDLLNEDIELLYTLASKLAISSIHTSTQNNNSHQLIRNPKNKGLIIRDESCSYFPSEGSLKLPLVGKITAGNPILAIENIEDFIAVPKSLLGNAKGKFFLLTVEGDSMINVGINQGDYVVVRQQNTAENGEVVIAMTPDSEATVKTFYKEDDHIRLQPENDKLSSMILEDVTLLGKVIAVYRVSAQEQDMI